MADRGETHGVQSGRDTAAAQVGGGLAAVAVTLVAGPVGLVLAPVAAVAVQQVLDRVIDSIGSRRRRRITYVLAGAAQAAGVEPDELISRLEGDPEREELLIRTLRAAQDCALEEKLVALASSLANGSQHAPPERVAWETTFVRALEDCDTSHLRLLRAFTQTANELGLGNGTPDFDKPLGSLNAKQLETALPELAAMLDPILSTVERHGLVRASSPSLGLSRLAGDGPNAEWALTRFGREFVERMVLVSQSVGQA